MPIKLKKIRRMTGDDFIFGLACSYFRPGERLAFVIENTEAFYRLNAIVLVDPPPLAWVHDLHAESKARLDAMAATLAIEEVLHA